MLETTHGLMTSSHGENRGPRALVLSNMKYRLKEGLGDGVGIMECGEENNSLLIRRRGSARSRSRLSSRQPAVHAFWWEWLCTAFVPEGGSNSRGGAHIYHEGKQMLDFSSLLGEQGTCLLWLCGIRKFGKLAVVRRLNIYSLAKKHNKCTGTDQKSFMVCVTFC